MLPEFNPRVWHACIDHDPKICSEAVNCYSYILNESRYYWSVPGLGFVKNTPQIFFDSFNNYFQNYSVEEFRTTLVEGAVKDGLIRLQKPEDRRGYYLAALVFPDDGNDFDFHWYRQDADGSWSHKNGWGVVTNKDDEGVMISDPREAVSQEFPIFGSFFLAPRQGIKLDQTFPLLSK
jgi:hypothetical protein